MNFVSKDISGTKDTELKQWMKFCIIRVTLNTAIQSSLNTLTYDAPSN